MQIAEIGRELKIRTRESRLYNVKNMLNASSENNLSTTIRTLCLESLGISEQTLANYSGGVLLITSVDTGIDSVCVNLNIFQVSKTLRFHSMPTHDSRFYF